MDPNKMVSPDELMANETSSPTNTSLSASPNRKSKIPWMALGDLVDDQVHPFVIRLEKTTIDPKIEKMYGPFEDTPLWAYPPLAASPKPAHLASTTQQMTNSKQDLTSEITRLKALIAERQRNNNKQRLEQKSPLQQQASPVRKQVDSPSSPIVASSSMAPLTPSAPMDTTMAAGIDQDKTEIQSQFSPDALLHTQASTIPSSFKSLPQTPTAAPAPPPILTSTAVIDSSPIQDARKDTVQGNGKGKAVSHDQLLNDGAPTKRSQIAERMETVHANASILDGDSEEKVDGGSVNTGGDSTTRLHGQIETNDIKLGKVPTSETDVVMTHCSNGGSNNNMKNDPANVITLSDSDSDLDEEEDNERAMLRLEEEKHKDHLTEIRLLQAEADHELDGMYFARRQLENYIRKITAPKAQQQSTVDSPTRQTQRKNPHPTTSDQSPSQKRQKSNDNRSIPQQKHNTSLHPTAQQPFGTNYPTNMAAAQSTTPGTSRITTLNHKPPASNIIPTRKILHSKPMDDHQKNEIKPLPGGMDVTDYFKEFADLVRNRAIITSELERLSTPNNNNNNSGTRSHRNPPHTEMLTTLDDLTFSRGPFRLKDGMKKLDNDNHLPLRHSESLLLAMMMDGIPRIPAILPDVRESLLGILDQAPHDFKTSLLHYKHGQLLSGLDSMLYSNLAAIQRHGNLELLWATYTELMVYRHGYSGELASSVLKAQQYHPFSLDIYWQTVFAAPNYSSRCALITEILKSISLSRSSPNFNGESTTVSEKSTEILLRTLKYNGLRGILDQLLPTTNANLGDAGRLLNISLNNTPSYIYISDNDLCFLWMSVVVYYVHGQLQQDPNRRHWYDRTSESGSMAPNTNTPFVIDWTIIPPQLLNDEEQTVVVTILLEMLSYFCQKARSNGAKKSLLVCVWRNLVGCLEILKCYGPPGTLMLLKRNMQATWKIKALQPEMADMTFELEKKMATHPQQIDMDPLCNKVLKSTGGPMAQLPAELFLAYRSALGLDPHSSDRDWKLLTVAWRLGRPLWLIYNFNTLSKLDDMKAKVINDLTEPPQELSFVQINYLCGLYSSALGVADSFEMLQVSKFNIKKFRKMPLAWINALMVHLIHFWLTRDPFLVQSFLKEISSPDVSGNLTGKDGRLLFMRFKKDCEKLVKN